VNINAYTYSAVNINAYMYSAVNINAYTYSAVNINAYKYSAVNINDMMMIIQFNSSLLMCRVYSQKANYRNSTTQIITDNEQDTKETDTRKKTKNI
jgi:hypothetical protein